MQQKQGSESIYHIYGLYAGLYAIKGVWGQDRVGCRWWSRIQSKSLRKANTQTQVREVSWRAGPVPLFLNGFRFCDFSWQTSDAKHRWGQMERSTDQKEPREERRRPNVKPWWCWHHGWQSRRVISRGIREENQVLLRPWKATCRNGKKKKNLI